MKILNKIFSSETISTLVATAINGVIVHALTDLGFWACAFFGYLGVEAFSASNRAADMKAEIAHLTRQLEECQQDVRHVDAKLRNLAERLVDESILR